MMGFQCILLIEDFGDGLSSFVYLLHCLCIYVYSCRNFVDFMH